MTIHHLHIALYSDQKMKLILLWCAVKQFLELVKNQHSKVIKQFHSDRGGEFKSRKFDELLALKGIVRQTSAPHIHQQNGWAECLNDTILEKAESMYTHAECPQSWWEFSFETAIHVYNRTPLRQTENTIWECL